MMSTRAEASSARRELCLCSQPKSATSLFPALRWRETETPSCRYRRVALRPFDVFMWDALMPRYR